MALNADATSEAAGTAATQAGLRIDPCAELRRIAPSMVFTTESMDEFDSIMTRAQENFETLDRNLAGLTKKKQVGNDFNAIFVTILEKYSDEVSELGREAKTGKYGPCRGPQSCLNSAMAGFATRHPDLFRKDIPKACAATVEKAFASYGLPSPSSGTPDWISTAATWVLVAFGCLGASVGIWAYMNRRKKKATV